MQLSSLLLPVLIAGANGFTPTVPWVPSTRTQVGSKTSLAMGVERTETTHTLYYVPSIHDINYDEDAIGVRPETSEEVKAWELSNDCGVKITTMARGANMVALNVDDTKYVWENIEGAVYYGANEGGWGNFPHKRGLSLNGGVRFAAVCAEHGLYYDTNWEESFSEQTTAEGKQSKSILYTIVDNDENREYAANEIPKIMTEIAKPETPLFAGMTAGQFSNDTARVEPMSKYPTTNMIFTYNITLVDGEDFARLRMSVENTDDFDKNAEAWLPMTFPIDAGSKILARQKERWRRDEWCFSDLPNIVPWDKFPEYDTCLNWPTGGIFYDFPKKDGWFHGVVTDSTKGRGVVYVCPDETESNPDALPHYTKMWSWGNKENFVSGGGSSLTEGRPASEYYEPWSSGTNFAFFNSAVFDAKTKVEWDVALLPITEGLTGTKDEMLDHV
jgi:hypothetical protein